MLAVAASAPVVPSAVITFTEQPVRLARGTSMYSAVRGAVLLANDLVDTGKSTLQLDAGGSTVALGPDSRVFIRNGAELVLLQGWMKVHGAPSRGPRLATAALQFDSTGASVTLHALPGTTELFAESGDLQVTELAPGKAGRTIRVPREQYAVTNGAQPLKLAAHPPQAYLAGMPRAFLDALVPVAVQGPPVPPRFEHAATLAELAPWLTEQPALRQQVQRRFQPDRPVKAPRPPTTDLF